MGGRGNKINLLNTPLEQFTVTTKKVGWVEKVEKYITIKNKYIDLTINKTTIYLIISIIIINLFINTLKFSVPHYLWGVIFSIKK